MWILYIVTSNDAKITSVRSFSCLNRLYIWCRLNVQDVQKTSCTSYESRSGNAHQCMRNYSKTVVEIKILLKLIIYKVRVLSPFRIFDIVKHCFDDLFLSLQRKAKNGKRRLFQLLPIINMIFISFTLSIK